MRSTSRFRATANDRGSTHRRSSGQNYPSGFTLLSSKVGFELIHSVTWCSRIQSTRREEVPCGSTDEGINDGYRLATMKNASVVESIPQGGVGSQVRHSSVPLRAVRPHGRDSPHSFPLGEMNRRRMLALQYR